jgi:hypothetical protein
VRRTPASVEPHQSDVDRSHLVKEHPMSEHTFDSFTRQAVVAITRRATLAAFSGAAMAAGLARQPGLAAKDDKKDKKKAKKQCNQQKDQCRAILIAAGSPAALICCESCFSNQVLRCLLIANLGQLLGLPAPGPS